MTKSVLIILLHLISLNIYAYSYPNDLLIFDGDTIIVSQIPLNENLHELIQSRSIYKDACSSMKCLEGYRMWEIRNDSLYLNALLNCCGTKILDTDSINLIYKEYGSDHLFANWVNNKVYHPFGLLIKVLHDRSFYEYDREFIIVNGLLEQIINYDNRQSKESIYSKNPELLLHFWLENIDWNKVEKYNLENAKVIVLQFEVGKNRKAINIEVMKSANELCDIEIIKALKKLPEWEIYYQKGQIFNVKWNIPVQLDKNWYLERIKQ